ncbi:10226_t:CDS:2 [Diversispora eburnea]|uniref:10226_t:CDS:1 n=1 Tax=Diversispora eburnea TaxID=1213867 RepID=A0A9N8V3J9_9GLOM|nr:10226_t:CDS:2 [Diversispora eburnea]
MVEVQDIESGIDKENHNVGDESVEDQNIENQVLEEVDERKVKCETKYESNSKVNYTVAWKEECAEWSINSTKSAINSFLKV